MSQKVTEYIDGMGNSGLQELARLWKVLMMEDRAPAYFNVFRVPLAASAEKERSFKGRYQEPPEWRALRDEHGVGRYEVVLMGSPPQKPLDVWQSVVRDVVFFVAPWMDSSDQVVPRGRACASMFDGIDFGMAKPPVPKPIATSEQPSLFNPEDVAIPKYVKDSDTSFMAAENIAPFVTELQQRVLRFILSRGEKGATCDEVEEGLGMIHQTASARINELKDSTDERPQMLFDSMVRRQTRHGQQATVWLHRGVLFG